MKNKSKENKPKENKKQSEPAKDAAPKRRSGCLFGLTRIAVILILVGYLLWSLGKENPKVRALFDRFTQAQNPIAAQVETLFTQGQTMGTFWNVKVAAPPNGLDGARLREIIQETLDRLDAMMSTYQNDSEVARFNRSESTDWFDVSPETAAVVATALDVSKATDGAFDITVAPLVDLWKFGPDKKPLAVLPSDDEIEKARARCGWKNLEVRTEGTPALRKAVPELSIDLSAVAKGYAVDAVAERLSAEGAANYLIDVGGEVRCAGQKISLGPAGDGLSSEKTEPNAGRWILGIEKPIPSADAPPIPYLAIQPGDAALATSGNARNFSSVGDVRFSHIIDPRTGRPTEMIGAKAAPPATEPGSVSVLDPSCVRADALATGLFVLGPDAGIELADRLGLAVVYILRSTGEGESSFSEKMSKRFAELESKRLDQKRP